jgi:hypothetical protein
MNKGDRKKLKQDYIKQDLEKLSNSVDPVLSRFARKKLGIGSESLTTDQLLNIEDDRLIETIVDKVDEIVNPKFNAETKDSKQKEQIFKSLNEEIRSIYFFYQLEDCSFLGDTEKFIFNSSAEEISETIKAFYILEFPKLSELIALSVEDESLIEELEKEITDTADLIRKKIVLMIRQEPIKFEIKNSA